MYIPAVVMFIGGTIVSAAVHLWARVSEDFPERPAGLSMPIVALLPLATSFVLFFNSFKNFGDSLHLSASIPLASILIAALASTFVGFHAKYLISGLTASGWGSLMGTTLAWVLVTAQRGADPLWANSLFFVCLALVGVQSLAGLLLGLWSDHRDRDEIRPGAAVK